MLVYGVVVRKIVYKGSILYGVVLRYVDIGNEL